MATEIFSPAEVKIIILGLQTTIEDLEAVSKDIRHPFTPESRKDMKDMLAAGYSAKKKLEDVVNKGVAFVLEEYKEGDEKDFLTKQS